LPFDRPSTTPYYLLTYSPGFPDTKNRSAERSSALPNDRKSSSDHRAALTADLTGGLSRRDFIRLNLAMLVLAGTSKCSWPDDPLDEPGEFRIIRPADLLALNFELLNLRIEHRRRKPARLKRIRRDEDALLVVRFPGQHILEQAFPNAADSDSVTPPVKSRIARPSRLVFKIPPDRDPIELTFDDLLDWRNLIPMLPAAGRGERIGPSSAERSIIEMPYGLSLLPDEAARWVHATQPVTRNGRTELWHTRLTSGNPEQPLIVTIQPPGYAAPDIDRALTSLTAKDRQQLTGRTAEARTLILSPMGGWLDVRGRWENDSHISRWYHRAAAGQDQRVVIQREEGFLYPFGQRATLISITERKLEEPRAGHPRPALLRKRDFIVIKKPAVSYEHGKMALSRMTALDPVTPPLQKASSDNIPFWIETEAGGLFRFRFSAQDWAGRRLTLDAPAIFVSENDEKIKAAQDRYGIPEFKFRRIAPLQGQPAAVAKFDSGISRCEKIEVDAGSGCDRWGDPLLAPRSVGDTTLHLLRLEFSGATRPNPEDPTIPFSCLTGRMEVRVPSLEPYLDEKRNVGWFDLVDPDTLDNLGEIFASARESDGPLIPMHFDRRADRCGGVAAPSFDVKGLSRVRGPVGDTGPMYEGGRFDPGSYFKRGRDSLLGGFSLIDLLVGSDGTKSPAVPNISFIMSRKQPDEKAAEKGARPHWEVGLGLKWGIGLFGAAAGELKISPARIVPELDAKTKRSKARLLLEAKVTKTLGQQSSASETEKKDTDPGKDGQDPAGVKTGGDTEKPQPPSVRWSAAGRLTNFAIELRPEPLGRIRIGFEHLGVKLGPPKPKPKKDAEDKKEKKDDEKKKKSVQGELDYKMSTIEADGMLFFLIKLIQIAADLPRAPDLSTGEASTAYPAKLPDAGDADISITVGPVEAPRFTWLNFKVSNVAASVGVGLYFLPRKLKASEPPVVPDNLFTIRIASADKPITLLSEPWGGIAHVGFNFTPRGLTGFQGSLGIVYRTEFDLGAARGKCEGSVAGIFNYEVGAADKSRYKFALVLKLGGQATIYGFIDVSLALVAVGVWQSELWSFYAEINVRIKISFFAVSARFRFNYSLSDNDDTDRKARGAVAVGEAGRLTQNEWLAYRSAFAEEGE
jgi:hypothetical protein